MGCFEAANGGTLFLDEIGNIPLHLQAKLLTALEQRRVTPVGRNDAIAVDVRVISATNLSREQLADEGRFRQDPLFRLNTVELTLPPCANGPRISRRSATGTGDCTPASITRRRSRFPPRPWP
ncbi:MAG: sigma 54-interacting transcriptional regulator [Halioglobus sp.]